MYKYINPTFFRFVGIISVLYYKGRFGLDTGLAWFLVFAILFYSAYLSGKRKSKYNRRFYNDSVSSTEYDCFGATCMHTSGGPDDYVVSNVGGCCHLNSGQAFNTESCMFKNHCSK